MIIKQTPIDGLKIIQTDLNEDERGYFSRVFCKNEFKQNNINHNIVQCNISHNNKAGTIRGMHYQKYPYEETKIIKCTRGSIFDVAVDIRINSETYLEWFAIELNAKSNLIFYIPEGFAHGYQTLENDTDVFYMTSEFYNPKFEGGIRWNDPAVHIRWPLQPSIISEKDKIHVRIEP